jgi:predicted nucleotidyltransferase
MPLPGWLSPPERGAIDAFVTEARRRLGSDLQEVRLFGSRARGEGNEDSDIDLAVIVNRAGAERRDELLDLAFDLGLQYPVRLAPLVLERPRLEALRQRERRLVHDIDRDGIPV